MRFLKGCLSGSLLFGQNGHIGVGPATLGERLEGLRVVPALALAHLFEYGGGDTFGGDCPVVVAGHRPEPVTRVLGDHLQGPHRITIPGRAAAASGRPWRACRSRRAAASQNRARPRGPDAQTVAAAPAAAAAVRSHLWGEAGWVSSGRRGR